MPSRGLKIVTLLSITLLVAWPLLLPASAWRYVSLGTQVDFDYKPWDARMHGTIVSVPLTHGDTQYWSRPIRVYVLWGNDAVAVTAVAVHAIGIKDDRNRLVSWFGDAEAGGTASKTAPPECVGGIEVCYTYQVVPYYRHFSHFDSTIEISKTVYVEASSEAEAALKVNLMFSRIALQLLVNSMIKMGSIYRVDVSLKVKYRTTIMAYDGRIEKWEHNYKEDYHRIIGYRNFELAASKQYITPLN